MRAVSVGNIYPISTEWGFCFFYCVGEGPLEGPFYCQITQWPMQIGPSSLKQNSKKIETGYGGQKIEDSARNVL